MKKRIIFILGLIAITAACSKSEESATDVSSKQSIMDKANEAAASLKDKTAEMTSMGTEIISNSAKTAAEKASAFVQKGSSTVVTATEDAKEALQEKAVNLMSKAPSVDSISDSEELSALTSNTEAPITEIPASTTIASVSQAELDMGKSIYTSKCFACHSTGVTGAPKLDDGSWSVRKQQGIDVMVDHAIKGFQGKKGYMPAKGGFAVLTDEEVAAAVAYMANAGN